MPWESAICTPYPLGYVVVLIKTRSPTTMVVPPVPTNWALFVFHEPDVKDERAIGLSAVRPPVVVIVSLTADVVSPLGVVVINSVQFVPSPDVPILTPITRGPWPVGVSRPDTITYSTAASTTVIATIRMVAITGDTAASSFRMMLFMVLSSCGLRRHLGTGEPTLLNVSWLIFEVENERIGYAREMERKEKREEGWGWMLSLAQGVCVQDSLGVGNLHAVPTRVRSRADQEPVSDDDRRASGPDELGLVGVPRGRRQRREGDRVERRQAAGCRDRQLNGRRRQATRCRRDQQRPVRSVSRRADIDTHHTRSLTRGRQQAGYHHVQHRGQHDRNRDHQDGRNHGRHGCLILSDDALHGSVLLRLAPPSRHGGTDALKRVVVNIRS